VALSSEICMTEMVVNVKTDTVCDIFSNPHVFAIKFGAGAVGAGARNYVLSCQHGSTVFEDFDEILMFIMEYFDANMVCMITCSTIASILKTIL
jgi:hypothetical protein